MIGGSAPQRYRRMSLVPNNSHFLAPDLGSASHRLGELLRPAVLVVRNLRRCCPIPAATFFDPRLERTEQTDGWRRHWRTASTIYRLTRAVFFNVSYSVDGL